MFPDVASVLDFGGGPGAYLTFFRDKGVTELFTIEPHDLGDCVFRGIRQLPVNIFADEVSQKADLMMTIEVAEHIPAELHPLLIRFLIDHSKKWIVFTAAHPGQPGEGHVGPAMKTAQTWIDEFTASGEVVYDAAKTREVKSQTHLKVIHTNLSVFRKVAAAGS